MITKKADTVNLTAKTATYTGSAIAANTATSTSGSSITYTYYSTTDCSGTALSGAPTNVGNYSVKATSAGNSNYSSGSKCVTHTINKGTPTISLTAKSTTYTGSAIVANKATAKNPNGSAVTLSYTYTYYSTTNCSGTALSGAPTNVGNYSVKATSAATSNLNSTSSSCVTHTITKGTPTISLTAKSTTYTGSAIAANTATTSSGGTLSYVYYSNSTCSTQTSTTTGASATGKAPVDVGNYYVKATSAATSNYNSASSSCVAHTIIKKSVSVTWGTTTSFTYNGSAQAPTASASSGVTSETINVGRSTGTNAGSYTSTATCSSVSGGRAKCSNYSLTGNTKAFTISKATPKLNLSSTSGTIQKSTITFTESSVQGTFSNSSSNTAVATVSPATASKVSSQTVTITGVKNGTSTITVSFTPTDTANYNSPASKTYTVTVDMYHTLTVKPNGGKWNSTSSDSTFTQVNGTTKSIGNPSKNAYYTVSYNGNGGSTPSATKAYRLFSSWSLSGGGTISNGTYTFGTQNGTLTANYNSTSNSTTLTSSSKSYTITYNTNSTGATSGASTQSANVSGIGWYNASSGGTKIASFGGSATFTGNTTLYAQWNSSSDAIKLATLTKDGYTCNWNTKSDGSGTSYSSGQTNVTFSASTTLYARCTANTYSIIYDANGGTGTTATTTYTYESTGLKMAENKFTRTGYTFRVWRLKREDGKWLGCTDTSDSVECTGKAGNSTLGWYDQSSIKAYYEPNGLGTWVINVKLSQGQNMRAYAQWTENTLRIQYSKGSATLSTNNSNISYDANNIITDNGETWLNSKKYSTRTETINLANIDNKSYIYLEYDDHKAISGKEWCTKTAGGGTCYNHDTDYKTTNFCDLTVDSCEITLYPNWNAIISSSRTGSYTMPSVCTTAGVTPQEYQFSFRLRVDDSPKSGKICYDSSGNGSALEGCQSYRRDTPDTTLGKCYNTKYGGAYFEKTHTDTSKSWYYYRSTEYVYAYVLTENGKTASKIQG